MIDTELDFLPKRERCPIYASKFEDKRSNYCDFANDELRGSDRRKRDAIFTNKKAAMSYFSKALKRPESDDELQRRLARFECKESKEAYLQWYKESASLLRNEVAVSLHENKLWLKFVPEPISKSNSTYADMERGSYIAVVEMPDGKLKQLALATDWVEANFTPQAIAIVQKVAFDTAQVHTFQDQSTSEYGYLSLENEEGNHKWDDRQISKIRWIPPKHYAKGGKPSTQDKGLWRGIVQTSPGVHGTSVILSQEWMDANITVGFQDLLKNLRNSKHSNFVFIPEGANEEHKESSMEFAENAPVTFYHSVDQINNTRRCVLDSAASGLHYLGYQHLSFYLNATKNDHKKTLSALDYFSELIETKMTKDDRKKLQLHVLKHRHAVKWDILKDSQEYVLCLIGVHSSDGKTDHAICIVGQWIFDSNYSRALELNMTSLNLCCSSPDRATSFVGVVRGCMLKLR